MIATAAEIAEAIGADYLVLTEFGGQVTVIQVTGLTQPEAQKRVNAIVRAGKLRPDAERYQVRSWLRQMAHDYNRPDLHPDNIPALIAAVTPEGLAREDALDRWATVNRIPADNPLVVLVAQQLGLTIPEIWPSILAR